MLTNAFAPCNGRFPLLIFLCSAFFAGSAAGGVQSELAEWKKLPDEGAITRGEYEEKKNEILHGRTDSSDWHA